MLEQSEDNHDLSKLGAQPVERDSFASLICDDFGTLVKNLPDLFELGLTLPCVDVPRDVREKLCIREAAEALSSFGSVFTHLSKVEGAELGESADRYAMLYGRTPALVKESLNRFSQADGFPTRSEATEAYFAARLPGHDFSEASRAVTGFLELYEIREGDEFLNEALNKLFDMRALAFSLCYLASAGSSEFVAPVREADFATALRYLLDLQVGIQPEVRSDNPDPVYSSTEFVCVFQLAKNCAREIIHGVSDVEVDIGVNETHRVVSVRDNGRGLFKEDRPFFAAEVGDIFGEFSSREGGGFGLQCVSELMKLSGGYIELISSPAAGPVLHYSTRSGEAGELPECDFKGTQFSLYTPR